MARTDYLFTSESVSEGHPDKVSDQISDAVVDLLIGKDPEARVACETLVTTNQITLGGEIRCAGMVDGSDKITEAGNAEIEDVARAAVKQIGYEQDGFDWQTAGFTNHLHGQSSDIAQGVDAGDAGSNKDEGAGDQGIMFGYACDETDDLMPATLHYSHRILERLAEDRHSSAKPFLEPDSKSQVTLRYADRRPVEATALVVSTQHAPGYHEGVKGEELADYVRGVFRDVLPDGYVTDKTVMHINPTG
ncbi:MAG: S-adenosylmethionine synthetase N-terminal domain-containing protein, partial [Pacificimonas sp.]